jgi:hypothetical protein
VTRNSEPIAAAANSDLRETIMSSSFQSAGGKRQAALTHRSGLKISLSMQRQCALMCVNRAAASNTMW